MENMARSKKPKLFADRPKCGDKQRYTSKREAEQIATQQEMLNYTQDLQLKVYRCATCGGWHLTRNHIQYNKP
jgi:hypothetical protein